MGSGSKDKAAVRSDDGAAGDPAELDSPRKDDRNQLEPTAAFDEEKLTGSAPTVAAAKDQPNVPSRLFVTKSTESSAQAASVPSTLASMTSLNARSPSKYRGRFSPVTN